MRLVILPRNPDDKVTLRPFDFRAFDHRPSKPGGIVILRRDEVKRLRRRGKP